MARLSGVVRCRVVRCGAARRKAAIPRWCRAGCVYRLGYDAEQSRQWSRRKHDDRCNVASLQAAVGEGLFAGEREPRAECRGVDSW